MLEAHKKQVPLKSYSLKMRIDYIQSNLEEQRKSYINGNINILTRITDRKVPCVYSYLSNNKKFKTFPV